MSCICLVKDLDMHVIYFLFLYFKLLCLNLRITQVKFVLQYKTMFWGWLLPSIPFWHLVQVRFWGFFSSFIRAMSFFNSSAGRIWWELGNLEMSCSLYFSIEICCLPLLETGLWDKKTFSLTQYGGSYVALQLNFRSSTTKKPKMHKNSGVCWCCLMYLYAKLLSSVRAWNAPYCFIVFARVAKNWCISAWLPRKMNLDPLIFHKESGKEKGDIDVGSICGAFWWILRMLQ